MDLGVHLPLMWECGFAAVSASDHLVFKTPWLDRPTALALAAIDVLSGGQLLAAVGPG